MRFYLRDNEIEVILSRRNLEAGLHKLDMPDSARELQSTDGPPGMKLRLRFEDDDEHYGHGDRQCGPTPGPMHPLTEAVISPPPTAQDAWDRLDALALAGWAG